MRADKLKVVAELAERWTSPLVQDHLTPAQNREVEKMTEVLLEEWRLAGVEVNVDCVYVYMSAVSLCGETVEGTLLALVGSYVAYQLMEGILQIESPT